MSTSTIAQAAPADDWPELPPAVDTQEIPLGGGPTDNHVASHFLELLHDDYCWATDLHCWLLRDGIRWRVAPPGALAAYIAGCAALTDDPAPLIEKYWPRLRKWARQGFPGGSTGWGSAYGTATFERDHVTAYQLLLRLRTPAGQHTIATMMARQAPHDECYTTARQAGELDAEPEVLWCGGMPVDLARSVDGPAWAIDENEYGPPSPWPATYPHFLSANYRPDLAVPVPLWDELMQAVFPDPGEREHALNALAHGLHGYPTDVALLARAATGLGKSLVASLVSDLLGDYSGQVNAATLFGRSGNAQFAFDEMAGSRFVVMNEGKKADFASTEAFKAVVSPDPLVNARARREAHRRLVAARHTLFLTVNPAADLDYSDPAVVRRLVPLGFRGDPQKIKKLATRYGTNSAEGLANWRAEAPGVLARLIVRCARVLADRDTGTRADLPASIEEHWEAVVDEAAPFGRWLAERTCDGLPTSNDDLAADYEHWCTVNRVTALTPTWWGRAMASAGIERARLDRTTRGWKVALRD